MKCSENLQIAKIIMVIIQKEKKNAKCWLNVQWKNVFLSLNLKIEFLFS